MIDVYDHINTLWVFSERLMSLQNLVAKANAKYSEEFVLHTLYCALRALQAMH